MEVKTRYGQIILKSISHHPRRPKYLEYQEQKAAGILRLWDAQKKITCIYIMPPHYNPLQSP